MSTPSNIRKLPITDVVLYLILRHLSFAFAKVMFRLDIFGSLCCSLLKIIDSCLYHDFKEKDFSRLAMLLGVSI